MIAIKMLYRKILIVGGTFDEKTGKPSSIVSKIQSSIPEACSINGGNIAQLEDLNLEEFSCVVWLPNIDNKHPKILPELKKKYPHLLLVSSKRVVEKDYTHFDIVSKLLKTRSNLGIMITKTGDVYNFELVDPLGNRFCNTTDLQEFSGILRERIQFLNSITRRRSYQKESEFPDLSGQIDPEYISLVKHYGTIFTEHVNAVNPSRFLGNTSTRCMKGFPSFRLDTSCMLVSRRNVDKETLGADDFVPVSLEKFSNTRESKMIYLGNNKPSVDSPIQIELYQKLKNINFMIHGHVYLETAEITSNIIPCGGLEEVEEIMNLIEDPLITRFAINLRGHGFLAGGNTLEDIKDLRFISRGLPEDSNAHG
jgi:hypothetical protein